MSHTMFICKSPTLVINFVCQKKILTYKQFMFRSALVRNVHMYKTGEEEEGGNKSRGMELEREGESV